MEWNDFTIGQNTIVTGDIKCVTSIYVSGQIDGTVYSDKNLFIKKNGLVKGQAECVEFNIDGTLEGTIKAKKVILSSDSKILGNIIASTLKIEEGATFIGSSKKIDTDQDSKLKNIDPMYEI